MRGRDLREGDHADAHPHAKGGRSATERGPRDQPAKVEPCGAAVGVAPSAPISSGDAGNRSASGTA